jgi:hypothetical protein
MGVSGAGNIRLLTNFQRLFIMAESALVLNTSTDGDNREPVSGGYPCVTSWYQRCRCNPLYFTNNPSVAILSGSNTCAESDHDAVVDGRHARSTYNDYRRTGFPFVAGFECPG